jgi:hypothetical protein
MSCGDLPPGHLTATRPGGSPRAVGSPHSGGFVLTLDSGIASRFVGVNAAASSARCGATPRAQQHTVEWCSLFAVLCITPGLAGCPAEATGAGGAATGTGGGDAAGGAVGSNPCTGSNDGATLIMTNCANLYCHSPAGDGTCGGLDLTVDAAIGSRLVGVLSSGTTANGSGCGGWPKPYLEPMVSPAAGLLIDKISLPPGSAGLCPNGLTMPHGLPQLSKTQQGCIEQWAEGLVMAAAQ